MGQGEMASEQLVAPAYAPLGRKRTRGIHDETALPYPILRVHTAKNQETRPGMYFGLWIQPLLA